MASTIKSLKKGWGEGQLQYMAVSLSFTTKFALIIINNLNNNYTYIHIYSPEFTRDAKADMVHNGWTSTIVLVLLGNDS
jgi:hypothetical protein